MEYGLRALYLTSLDDDLRILFDFQQLITQLVGFATLSVSLYAIPTTVEQRAKMFQSVRLLRVPLGMGP